MGYIYCKEHSDETIRRHTALIEKRLKIMRYFLVAATIFVQNRKRESLLKELKVFIVKLLEGWVYEYWVYQRWLFF
jgi:hypothetical protein